MLPVSNSPKPPPERITLSMPVLNAGKNVAVVALGQVRGLGCAGAGCGVQARAGVCCRRAGSWSAARGRAAPWEWAGTAATGSAVAHPTHPCPDLSPPRPPGVQGKAEVVQRALEVQTLPGALPVQLVQPTSGEPAAGGWWRGCVCVCTCSCAWVGGHMNVRGGRLAVQPFHIAAAGACLLPSGGDCLAPDLHVVPLPRTTLDPQAS